METCNAASQLGLLVLTYDIRFGLELIEDQVTGPTGYRIISYDRERGDGH